MAKLSIAKHLLYIFAISSILFMSIAALFIYMEKYIQSLLSFVIGILFLSSTLAILREGFRDEEGAAS
jgi:hypothetical protein